ncbi:MAG: hypothetical protein BWY70_01507 [Bacteroidetes bacterium ADurb.Bin408]|nr:MAG: hypothetical protein BWY70_01507 [Bacteroidetes bacterium ADurb.Bin408]
MIKSFPVFKTAFVLACLFAALSCVPDSQKEKEKAERDSLLLKQKEDSLIALKTDWKAQELNDSVESIRLVTYKALEKFGEIQKGDRVRDNSEDMDYYKVFNNRGNIVERYEYQPDGSLDRKTVWKYNKKGQKTEALVVLSDKFYKSSSLETKNLYKYDTRMNITEQSIYESGGKRDGAFTGKMIFKFDSSDKLTEKNIYFAEDKLYTKTKFVYDARRNKTEENIYNTEGALIRKIQYKYNEQGQLTESGEYNPDGILFSKTKFKYNTQGQLECEHTYSTDGNLDTKCLYEYDEKGNWTKAVKYKNDIPQYIRERIIEYF